MKLLLFQILPYGCEISILIVTIISKFCRSVDDRMDPNYRQAVVYSMSIGMMSKKWSVSIVVILGNTFT